MKIKLKTSKFIAGAYLGEKIERDDKSFFVTFKNVTKTDAVDLFFLFSDDGNFTVRYDHASETFYAFYNC